MGERDLTGEKLSVLEKDVTRIDFPRPINETEAEELLKYFVAQLDDEGNSRFAVSVNFSQNRHYGDRMKDLRYESLDGVRVRKGDTELAGTVTTILHGLKAASFSFRNFYDKLDRPAFNGLDFTVTPDYEPGELNSDDVEIMKNMRKYVNSYFENADKK